MLVWHHSGWERKDEKVFILMRLNVPNTPVQSGTMLRHMARRSHAKLKPHLYLVIHVPDPPDVRPAQVPVDVVLGFDPPRPSLQNLVHCIAGRTSGGTTPTTTTAVAGKNATGSVRVCYDSKHFHRSDRPMVYYGAT